MKPKSPAIVDGHCQYCGTDQGLIAYPITYDLQTNEIVGYEIFCGRHHRRTTDSRHRDLNQWAYNKAMNSA